MLVPIEQLANQVVFSLQTGAELAKISLPIIDPRKLTIAAFYVNGSNLTHQMSVLHPSDIREINSKLENEKVDLPKIFLSELMLEEFSYDLQKTFHEIFDNKSFVNDGLLMGGRKWEIDYEKYIKLSKESEYAAWLYVWGFCPNHFTISVNHLEGYKSLEEVNALIKKNGFKLNESGGEIKGSPEDLLEQSSIIADLCAVDFSGESHEVPSCYYEFAKRYEISEGEMYQGFIAKSADKIFESTNLQK